MGRVSDNQTLQLAYNLALSGAYPIAWDIAAELRSLGYHTARDLLNNKQTREQLNRMCAEAQKTRRHA